MCDGLGEFSCKGSGDLQHKGFRLMEVTGEDLFQAGPGLASLYDDHMRSQKQPPLLVSFITNFIQSDSVLLGPCGPKVKFSKRQ